MSRLHEYQGKELLRKSGIDIPRGRMVTSPQEAAGVAAELGAEVVLKAQAWVTGRFGRGLIWFAGSPEEASAAAAELLGQRVNNFTVESLLVEERLAISDEYYAGIIINDTRHTPELVFSSRGGSGIEEIAREHPESVARCPISVTAGLRVYQARNLIRGTGLTGDTQRELADILVKLWRAARQYEARVVEINPLVRTRDGRFLAADCRFTVDDYAVFRHPELGIEIAREFDHPPTRLEKIAWDMEKNDYRGTFYFIQLEQGFGKGEGYLGFHGAGGGGSMMSMDAVQKRGFKIANFTDTSGNPPASKVYRAARIILSQKNIDGYFGSGSGVASQEQVNSARGLVKAFREAGLAIPAVVRLGGNMEDEAVAILTEYTRDLPGRVEGYRKDDTADFCAGRMRILIQEANDVPVVTEYKEFSARRLLADAARPYRFKTTTGEVVFDHARCAVCRSKACIQACGKKILKLEAGLPVLAVSEKEAAGGACTECLACELECWFHGEKGCYVYIPVPGLDESEGEAAG